MDNLMGPLAELINNLDARHGILLIGGIVLSQLFLYSNAMKKVRGSVTGLISQAEAQYGQVENSGKLKTDAVVSQLYQLLPAPYRVFFPESRLEKIVRSALDHFQVYASLQKGGAPRQADTPPYAEYIPGGGLEGYPAPDTEFYAEPYAEWDAPEPSAVFRVEYLRPDELRVVIVRMKGDKHGE